MEDAIPVLRVEIQRLQSEIQRLRGEKPDRWLDLSRRYTDAIEGLKEETARAEAKGKPKPKKKAR